MLHFFWLHYLVALPFLGKVTEAFLSTLSGYEMAAKIVAWGVILLPLLQHTRAGAELGLGGPTVGSWAEIVFEFNELHVAFGAF